MPKQKGKGARAKELVKGPVDLCKAPISGKGKIAKEKWPARQAIIFFVLKINSNNNI